MIEEDNAEIVQKSDVVFIGLLPNVAAEVLNKMPFRDDQTVDDCYQNYRISVNLMLIFSLHSTDHLYDGCRGL